MEGIAHRPNCFWIDANDSYAESDGLPWNRTAHISRDINLHLPDFEATNTPSTSTTTGPNSSARAPPASSVAGTSLFSPPLNYENDGYYGKANDDICGFVCDHCVHSWNQSDPVRWVDEKKNNCCGKWYEIFFSGALAWIRSAIKQNRRRNDAHTTSESPPEWPPPVPPPTTALQPLKEHRCRASRTGSPSPTAWLSSIMTTRASSPLQCAADQTATGRTL